MTRRLAPVSIVAYVLDSPKELGLLIKLHREHRGLTQPELAAAVRTNRTAIAHLEQGLRLPAPLLERVAQHLEIPPAIWQAFAARDDSTVRVRCHCLTYYTPWRKGNMPKDARLRDRLVYAVKNNEPWINKNGKRADPYAASARRLLRYFPAVLTNRILVPVPRCLKSSDVRDDQWASLRLANALAAVGSLLRVARVVRRAKAIRKSSDPSKSHTRPSVAEHRATLAIDGDLSASPRILLVDDMITRGTTVLACAASLRAAGWRGDLCAMAVAYDIGKDDHDPGEAREVEIVWDGRSTYPRRAGTPTRQ